jgi:HK97 family phage major capsid protein
MSQILNARKKEIIAAQEHMLDAANESKRQLFPEEETQFTALSSELDAVNVGIGRYAAIENGKREVGAPREQIVITDSRKDAKFTNCTAEYAAGFWNELSKNRGHNMRTGMFNAAALSETGTAGDGSYLVPSQTDPSIASMAVLEAAARSLSQVIETEMDIKLPYQASKSVAAGKAESTDGGLVNFATNVPTFNTTTLSAHQAGDFVTVSWELLQDSKALSQFLTADLNRAVYNYEETKFISGSGTGEPLGYLNGATAFATEALNINAILDLEGALRSAYYPGAGFLFNRQEWNRLRKEQLAANQFQSYISNVGTNFFLDGYPVKFSTAMPVFQASPATTGAVLFGDFNAGWTIGDRGGSDIRVKVLDQVAAISGQTIFLGYRRTDQRCRMQEAVQLLTTNA